MAARKKATEKVAEENDIVSEIVSEETAVVEDTVEKTRDEENAEKVISGPEVKKRVPVSGTVTDDDGVIGSRGASKNALTKVLEEAKPVESPALDPEKVAIWSPRHIHAGRSLGVPSLQTGYNFLTRKEADVWLNLKKDVREATPDEVAKHFGV